MAYDKKFLKWQFKLYPLYLAKYGLPTYNQYILLVFNKGLILTTMPDVNESWADLKSYPSDDAYVERYKQK